MVFITKSGKKSLKPEITSSEEYKDVKEILEHFGYVETSPLKFESSRNEELSDISHIREMARFLEGCGLTYSRELEVNIIKDLDSIREDDGMEGSTFSFDYETLQMNPIGEGTKNKLIISKNELFKFEHNVPGVGDKIRLYFYLFLEFGFDNSMKPIIQFGGGFSNSEDMDSKNYIRIVESDFVRVKDGKNPNTIILHSTKKQDDFLKEVGILYNGFFRYQRKVMKGESVMLQEKKFNYKMAEVKRFLNPDQSIVIETNRMGYDRLLELSEKIRVEQKQENKRYIAVEDIKFEAIEMQEFLTEKMVALSEEENYEEAASMQKDIQTIGDMIEYVDDLDRTEITAGEYFSKFSIS